MGDRAYLVTFETIDPLWVLDLSDPTSPIILGELEVPGVSTYIHPVDDNTLLTIGIGPGDDGLGLPDLPRQAPGDGVERGRCTSPLGPGPDGLGAARGPGDRHPVAGLPQARRHRPGDHP